VKRTNFIISFTFLFFIFSSQVFASSINLQNGKSLIGNPDEEYTVDLTLSINAQNNTLYYLRGVFFKPNTNDYCGYTWNGNSWFSGPYSSSEGWKNFLAVTINNSSWSGTLRAKIDPSDTDCKDSGEYHFKVQRFTATSSSGSFDSQTEQIVQVIIPTPTPTPSPTPEPTNTPTPTKEPTPTKIPTPTNTLVPTQKPSPTFLKEKTPTPKKITPTALPTKKVLGESTSINKKLTATPRITQSTKVLNSAGINPGLFFISLGGVFLIACGILAFYLNKKTTD
jgi:hypothetical protein